MLLHQGYSELREALEARAEAVGSEIGELIMGGVDLDLVPHLEALAAARSRADVDTAIRRLAEYIGVAARRPHRETLPSASQERLPSAATWVTAASGPRAPPGGGPDGVPDGVRLLTLPDGRALRVPDGGSGTHPDEVRLRAALAYAQRFRFAVLPLWWLHPDGTCACGSRKQHKAGKHPLGLLVPHGVHDASKDPDTIRRWWDRFPMAHVGIATGAISRIAVLDPDPRHGGMDTLARMERAHGALPPTPTVLTGYDVGTDQRGEHRYFSIDGPMPSGILGPGVDFQGDGRLVVAPPSPHFSGVRYEWEAAAHIADIPLEPLPSWIASLVGSGSSAAAAEPATVPRHLPLGRTAFTFMAGGAPIGQQAATACGVARNLQGASFSLEDAVEWISQGLQACELGDPEWPWEDHDAERIVRQIWRTPPPPLRDRQRPAAPSCSVSDFGKPDAGPPYQSTPEEATAWRATLIAATAESRSVLPLPEGVVPRTAIKMQRRRDDPGSAVCRRVISNGWANTANARIHQQRLWAWYTSVADREFGRGGDLHHNVIALERLDVGRDPARTAEKEAVRSVREAGGDYVALDVPAREQIHLVATRPFPGSHELTAEGARALLTDIMGEVQPGAHAGYRGRRNSYRCSRGWTPDLPKTENKEWEDLGGMRGGEEMRWQEEDALLVREAQEAGLAVRAATAEEVAATGETILSETYVVVPEEITDREERAYRVLSFFHSIGVRLRSGPAAELKQYQLRRRRRAA